MELIKQKLNSKEREKRSISQNSSLHLWLEQLAEVLNRNGITLKAIVEKLNQAECPATKEGLKYAVWHAIQRALYGKKSTTELLKQGEIDTIFDVINKMVAENWHISIPPFPSQELKSWDEELGK